MIWFSKRGRIRRFCYFLLDKSAKSRSSNAFRIPNLL